MSKEIAMLCRSWSGEDPTGWWMSEKYDGVRLIRLPGNRYPVTREGNAVYPPEWWVDQLPDTFIDGEAWIARGMFEQVKSIVTKAMSTTKPIKDKDWHCVVLKVIEPFGLTRYGVIAPIWQATCRGYDHLQEFFDGIVAGGGEGVVIRNPKQPYHCGRSPYMLKLKPERKATAIVTDWNENDGKLVSLECSWFGPKHEHPGGVHFSLSNGLTEALRSSPPHPGAIVKLTYQCLTDDGKPRFARLAR